MDTREETHRHTPQEASALTNAAPAEYWEDRYAGTEVMWSGRVNRVLADVCTDLTSGTALDLGCGEGGDVIWLAQMGWNATGIDISTTAICRARDAARAQGFDDDRARFIVQDLADLSGMGQFDLVTASFLHSPVELPREQILRQAAIHVAAGGHLLVTGHAGPPPWAAEAHDVESNDTEGHDHAHVPHHRLPTPDEQVAELELGDEWTVVIAELREREAVGPDGETATLTDSVVLMRRQ